MTKYKCPVCGNPDIMGRKYPVAYDSYGADIHLHDFFCPRCHTLDSCSNDSPDFSKWYARWVDKSDIADDKNKPPENP
jgi:hypothetical protein